MPGSLLEADRRNGEQTRILTNRMVTIVSGRRGEVVTADTVNLGPGGMFVATDTPFGVGDRFICRIDLGEPYKPVLSGAEVRWINDQEGQQGMGVQFLDIGEAANSLSGELVPHGLDSVRLRMQAVGPALEAKVVERAPQQLVIDVALPFLGQGTQVDVGPDIAARTAAVDQVEWLGGDEEPKVRLTLSLEPAASQIVAEHVAHSNSQVATITSVEEAPAETPPGQDAIRPAGWQRPAPPVTCRPARKEVVDKTDPVVEPNAEAEAVHEDDPAAPAATSGRLMQGLRSLMAAVAAKALWLVSRMRTLPTTMTSHRRYRSLMTQFSSLKERPAIKKLVGGFAAPLARKGTPLVGKVRGLGQWSAKTARRAWLRVKTIAKTPRLSGWTARVKTGWKRVIGRLPKAERLVTLFRRVWTAAKAPLSKLWRRPRKQTRGVPSPAVARMMERAKLAATGRGRTVLWGMVVVIGLAGLATLGYGLLGTVEAEARQDQVPAPIMMTEENSDWRTPTWHEPDPVRSDS
jgi:Tfp pilus assembly protein PilZ